MRIEDINIDDIDLYHDHCTYAISHLYDTPNNKFIDVIKNNYLFTCIGERTYIRIDKLENIDIHHNSSISLIIESIRIKQTLVDLIFKCDISYNVYLTDDKISILQSIIRNKKLDELLNIID